MGTIPTIATFPASGVVTSAYLNSHKTANDFWARSPRCFAYQASVQSVASSASTYVVMALDGEVFDYVQSGDSPGHDLVTNNSRLIVATPGIWEISGQVQFASNATGFRAAQVKLNAAGNPASGTILGQNVQGAVSGAATSIPIVPFEWPMNAGDYVELFGLQNSGGALNTGAGSFATFLRMKLTSS